MAIPLVAYGQTPGAAPAFVTPSIEDLAIGCVTGIVAIVLLVELARYVVPGMRRRKGEPLGEGARIGVVVIALGFGELLAFFGVAPAVSPGPMGKVTAGIVVTGIAVLFNETVMAAVRSAVRKRAGTTGPDEDDEGKPAEPAK